MKWAALLLLNEKYKMQDNYYRINYYLLGQDITIIQAQTSAHDMKRIKTKCFSWTTTIQCNISLEILHVDSVTLHYSNNM